MPRKLSNKELNRLSVHDYERASKNPIVIVLDNVRSMHNVGSIFRTADAFRIEMIALCGVTGKPPHREIEKTALGATNTVKWKYYPDTISCLQELKDQQYKITAVEQAEHSVTLSSFKIQEPVALIFGNEVYGVEQSVIDLCDTVVEIPQQGSKHSLNVAVSAGIVLWELLR